MIEIEIPKPVIQTKKIEPRVEQEALRMGLHPILAQIVATRPLTSDLPVLKALFPKLKDLSSPFGMKGMEKAAKRVAAAIQAGEIIGIETDHDCDGQTSHAVIYDCLVNHFHHPSEKIRSYIGHRLTEGYGLSEPVVTRILNDSPKVQLLITADNGSSDEPRIKKLKTAEIDVIVTDHHEIPKEGIPESAFACLNPTQLGCEYGDPLIAGCLVAWILMAATRQQLIEQKHLPMDSPSLAGCLDFVAVGTIADCVSMARSVNNRAVVSYGLKLIEKGLRPCWRAIQTTLDSPLSSEDLGFKVGPLLNSDGRLSTAFGSVSFLLSETDEEAMAWLFTLQDSNAVRKSIQQDIIQKSLHIAKEQMHQGKKSLCIYLEDGHSGIHGIAASRLKDLFGRPTVFFAPKVSAPGLITGSVRGIEKFHVREALQFVSDRSPTLLVSFGGHQGAGGLTIEANNFSLFQDLFEKAVSHQLINETLGPVIWTDGKLCAKDLSLELVDLLNQLEPFGREFEQPIFELMGFVREIRYIGDGTHARILLESDGHLISGVWFKIRQSQTEHISIQTGDWVRVAFSIKANTFRGNRRFEIYIVYMETIKN